MGWYKFSTKEEFNTWHEAIKLALGYPFLSKDFNGNDCEPLNTEYTSLMPINDELKAWVDEENAEGLRPTTEPVYPSRYEA